VEDVPFTTLLCGAPSLAVYCSSQRRFSKPPAGAVPTVAHETHMLSTEGPYAIWNCEGGETLAA
jgi:hypothetical protein